MGRFGIGPHRQNVLAHIHLHAIVPLLEEVAEKDPESMELAKGADGSIQFRVLGGPCAHVIFRGDRVIASPGPMVSPTVGILFPTCSSLNKTFRKQGFPVAIPYKGFNRLDLLKSRFEPLAQRVEHYLTADPVVFQDEASLLLAVELRLYAGFLAAKALADHDPVGRAVAADLPNGVAEFRVGDSGPCAHVKVESGRISVAKGPAVHPDGLLKFSSPQVAFAFLGDQMDVMASVPLGDPVLSGLIPLVDGFGHLLEGVSAYLE